jgi:NAD(P)-dependent dehydrogenase (short-subunit alcohol dehydrogenase family)
MAGKLEDKVIVVAGAGGIGSGLAERFVREGARVVLGDINADGAAEVAREIDPTGERIIATHVDGADEASVAELVKLALSRFGRLNGFHANFAVFNDSQSKDGVLTTPLATYDQMMNVNARGYVICTQQALPPMIEGGGGSIVYTSSADAYRGAPVRVAYSMSKAAIHALMRHTASRYGRKGIRANVISPGLILHEKQLAKLSPDFLKFLKEDAARYTALTRFGTPDDIATTAALLLSDEGSYITGQVINVDGGLTMRA